MAAKAVLMFCAQALLVQCISSQCLHPGYKGNTPKMLLAAPGVAAPCTAAERTVFRPAASNGEGLAVTSVSPFAVTGITMTSENAYEGPLTVSGAMPFLGTVALKGALPTTGAGAITYGCRSGNVRMLSENNARLDGYAPLAYETGIAGLGYGLGYNNECGCGDLY